MTGRLLFLLALMFGAALPASAHKPSDSYLALAVEGETVRGQWDIALRDLEFAIGVDGNGDGQLTWDEIRARHQAIAAYALARLTIAGCPVTAGEQLIDKHTDGAYTVLRFTAACGTAPKQLDVDYRLFADTDPQHKGLVKISANGATMTAIFGVDQPVQSFAVAGASTSRLGEFVDYVKHGVWHIWIGFDHILFLLSLLLPAVLVWRGAGAGWEKAPDFRSAAIDVLKIISAFTLAHSVTLSLAALGLVSLPSRWVESAIAASVVIAALNNIVPIVQGRRWVAAFVFGLIHGFGFASVLADLGLPQGSLALALVGFNVGVELGQVAIVAAFLPLAYVVRASWFYRRVVLVGGSVAIAALAVVWLGERALDVELLAQL
ncbi:HupE/UreJ family protein [Massilia sp. GCM10020059]|uniref:HupE/UreJ family protein n=1 Tax=Massilia agrisoli TaxID=2892444 RepID=A0ABS8IXE6_9BURK|nr:HupE/UreJ family protein [Massilia agrisoli]MCC6072558.1 HupE/UreJ family protein [Massilia agrisoli]